MRKKSVEVDLGGQVRLLKLNLNAVASFEEHTGKSMGSMKDEFGRVPVSTLRVLLWALLVTDSPKMTIEDAGAMVDFDNLAYVSEKITELMAAAAPKGASAVADVPLPPTTQAETAGAS
jgi:hypothetical protein